MSNPAPAVWHLVKLPPAGGWGPDSLRSAAPAVDGCTWELLPELPVSEPAPGSLPAAFLSACRHVRAYQFIFSLHTNKTDWQKWWGSYSWRESTLFCNCKLALCKDSLMSIDDLKNFVWLSICMSKKDNADKRASTVRQKRGEKTFSVSCKCTCLICLIYKQHTRGHSRSRNHKHGPKCPPLQHETRKHRRPQRQESAHDTTA